MQKSTCIIRYSKTKISAFVTIPLILCLTKPSRLYFISSYGFFISSTLADVKTKSIVNAVPNTCVRFVYAISGLIRLKLKKSSTLCILPLFNSLEFKKSQIIEKKKTFTTFANTVFRLNFIFLFHHTKISYNHRNKCRRQKSQKRNNNRLKFCRDKRLKGKGYSKNSVGKIKTNPYCKAQNVYELIIFKYKAKTLAHYREQTEYC